MREWCGRMIRLAASVITSLLAKWTDKTPPRLTLSLWIPLYPSPLHPSSLHIQRKPPIALYPDQRRRCRLPQPVTPFNQFRLIVPAVSRSRRQRWGGTGRSWILSIVSERNGISRGMVSLAGGTIRMINNLSLSLSLSLVVWRASIWITRSW